MANIIIISIAGALALGSLVRVQHAQTVDDVVKGLGLAALSIVAIAAFFFPN